MRRKGRAIGIVLIVVTLSLALLGAAMAPRLRTDNSLDVWIAGDGLAARAHARIAQAFGDSGGEAREIVVAWEEDDPLSDAAMARGQAIAARLRAIKGVRRALGLADLLAGLEIDPKEMPADAWAHPLLAGAFIGERATAVWVELAAVAPRDHIDSEEVRDAGPAGEIGDAVDEILAGLTHGEHAAGAPVLNRALDRAARAAPRQSMPWMIGATLASMLVVAFLTRRKGDWPGALLLLFLPALCGGAAVGVTLGTMVALDASMNLVTTAAPGVAWVIGFAAAVHTAFALRNRCAARAVVHGIAWSTVTTAAGLLSLLASGVPALAMFGVATAVGITVAGVLASGILLVFAHETEPEIAAARSAPLAARKTRWIGAVLVLAVGLGFACGIARLQPGGTPLDFLPASDRTSVDTRWVEQRLSGVMPVLIVLEGSTTSARMQTAQDLARAIVAASVATTAWSGLDLQELPPTALGLELVARQESVDASLSIVRARAVSADRDSLSRLRDVVAMTPGAIVTGVVPLIVDLQEQLLRAQSQSLIMIVPVLAIALALVTRSIYLTVVGLIVNVLPAAAMLGWLGLGGRGLDPATAMVAAIAVGIAVDDTIHLLVHQRAAAASGAHAPIAMAMALRQAGPAITTTTWVLVAGFATFFSAPFVPVRDFGVLTATALLFAWVADVLILPALVEAPHHFALNSTLPEATS